MMDLVNILCLILVTLSIIMMIFIVPMLIKTLREQRIQSAYLDIVEQRQRDKITKILLEIEHSK